LSTESPGPGWWQAETGYWYPPEARLGGPSTPQSARFQNPPDTGTTPRASTNGADFVASSPRSPRGRLKSSAIVGTVVAVAIAGGIFVLDATSAPVSHDLGSSAPVSSGGNQPSPAGGAVSSAPTTTSASSAAVAEARQIELQASDLGQGWVPGSGTDQVQTSASPPGPCNLSPSGNWLANMTSAGFESPALWNAYSQVLVMPNAADAREAFNTFRAASYPTNCLRPTWDQWVKQTLAAYDQQTTCALTFGGSSIGAAPAEVMPEDVPGSVGYQYEAQVNCPSEGSSTLIRDVIGAVEGNVFVEAQFYGGSSPPAAIEPGVISQMDYRASQIEAGKPADG